MAAYIIANIDVTNPTEYQDYVKVSGATVARYGGRFLVRGGRAEALEGQIQPKRLIVIEFDNASRAHEWWDSNEYAGPKAIRQRTAMTDMILVEGVSPMM